MAVALFVSLHYDMNINFYEGRAENLKPSWWKVKLGFEQWRCSRVAGNAYNRLLSGCGLSWGKVIHMRAAGIEHASAMGELDAAAVSTLSKHQKSNLDKVYMTELFPPILRVMAGFSNTENKVSTNSCIYHVPRTLVELPWTDDQVTSFIFPRVEVWRAQFQSPEGDTSEAARNFLYGVLPFLAKVVVQDGIYWIKDYPSHEISRLLLNAMPPSYERWSMDTRKKIIDEEMNNNEVLSSSLNEGAKAALLSVKDALKNEMQHLRDNVAVLNGKLDVVTQQLSSLTSLNIPRTMTTTNDQQNQETPPPIEILPTIVPPLPIPTPDPPITRRILTEVLRSTEKVPVFPPSLPKTMKGLLNEYERFQLSRWETAKMSQWPGNVKQAFSRRKYMNNVMKSRAMCLRHGTYDQRLKRTVESMESERHSLGLSIFQYIKYLKENDPTVRSRKRKI